MIRTSLKSSYLLLLLMTHVHSSPPTTIIDLPFLEENTIGSEVHNLMEETPENERNGISFKLISQYMRLGEDEINDDTEWVTLNKLTGVISVATPVDREKHCNADQSQPCVIHVKVIREPQWALHWFDIKLNVIDINDHAPTFPVTPIISVNISEAAPVNMRLSLDNYLATDADAGTNSEIYYSLSRSDYFSIHQFTNPNTGDPQLQLVVTNDLDREQTSSYDLILTATDQGSPERRSSSVTLHVVVIDANDNQPVFDSKVYHVMRKENAKPGQLLTTVHAVDNDDNIFGEIRYFVPSTGNSQAAENLVEVDSINGEVRLKKPLDREKHNNLRVVIAARDLASENQRKVGKTILAIKVEDENDNAPIVHINVIVKSNGSVAFLSESSHIGTYIAQVTADDPDDGVNSKVQLQISTQPLRTLSSSHQAAASTETGSYFALDEGGFIKTTSRMDRESLSGYLIDIQACDEGSPQLCSSRNLTVILLDENDNSPIFISSPKSMVLDEDTDLGTVIVQVTAFDQDSTHQPSLALTKNKKIKKSLNGEIRYSLLGGGSCFVIDDVSGKIRLVQRLDYEEKKTWKMTVTAWDMGDVKNSANLSVIVHVSDVNDNVPVFTTPAEFNHTVAATIRSSDVIIKIRAVDADDGKFSEISYSIVGEDNGKVPPRLFILDKFNGNLRLNMSNPHLRHAVGSHLLHIKAQDSGNPPLYGVTMLHIRVFDLPQAVLPTFTWVTEPVQTEEQDLTLVMIAGVASSALLLAIILAVVFITCKRNKQGAHIYHCKSAAPHRVAAKNSCLSHGGGALVSGRSLIFSSQLSLNSSVWKKNKENGSDIIATKSAPRQLHQKTGSLFQSAAPVLVDRDSGRGDSDHETASCDERDFFLPTNLPENSQLFIVESLKSDENLGPMCTNFCKQYGHSDSCWMPNTEIVEPLPDSTQSFQYDFPEFRNVTSYSAGGLDTISETQPLHTVLNSNHPGIFPINSNLDPSPGVMLLNSGAVRYHTTSTSAPSTTCPHPEREEVASSYFYTEQDGFGNRDYSVSEMFHDGYAVFDPSNSSFAPSPQYPPTSNLNFFLKNRVEREITSAPRETLQPHFAVAAQRFPRLEETESVASFHQPSANTPGYEEVSMEETQKIIENIERLIDH